MKQATSILIIEDNNTIVEAYISALNKLFDNDENLRIDTSHDCDSALKNLIKAGNTTPYDLLLIDISLPPSADGSITSGEDLAFRAKHWFPNAKIAIVTAFFDEERMNRIIKQIDPHGLLVKGDVTYEGLAEAIKTILNDQKYYSASIKQ
jgi:DNA-binding NarL/FixJ family response regulator